MPPAKKSVARILYGAPESEREEENVLVAKLRNRKKIAYSQNDKPVTYVRETHQVEYLNDFLGFAWELSRCRNSILLPQKYDLVIYDSKVYGENWFPDIRAEHFKLTITPFLQKKETPVIILADELIKDALKEWIEKHQFHYVAQPYFIDEVLQQVSSLLPRQRKKP